MSEYLLHASVHLGLTAAELIDTPAFFMWTCRTAGTTSGVRSLPDCISPAYNMGTGSKNILFIALLMNHWPGSHSRLRPLPLGLCCSYAQTHTHTQSKFIFNANGKTSILFMVTIVN